MPAVTKVPNYGGGGGGGGSVTDVTATSPLASSGGATPDISLSGVVSVAKGGTGVTASTGTVAVVLSTSPTLITPVLGVASATSLANTGTAGAGFVELLTQSSNPSAPASGFREFADSTGRRSWRRGSDGFVRTWDSTLTADRVYSLPDATTTIVGTDATQTLTNKRVTARTSTEASSATPTINTDNVEMHRITALAANITSMTTNLSGTPTIGQRLIIRILDNGTARTITWGASFASRGATLPTTTVLSKYLYVGFIWNDVTSTWDCLSVAQEL